MDSKLNQLKIYIKNGQYGTAIKKIIGWFSHRLDTLFTNMFSLLPIRQNVILFRSLSDFSDNARVFYDYMIEHGYNKDYKLVWILDDTNPRDYSAPYNVKFIKYKSWHPSISRDYYYAVAKCIIVTHVPGRKKFRKGQTLINTSHSASQLKAPKESSLSKGTINRKIRRERGDYMLACGPDGVKKKEIAQGINKDHLPIIGMPRLDLLYKGNDCLPKLLDEYNGERIILSMETFKQATGFIDSNNSNDIYAINVVHSKEELIKLDAYLKQYNTILIVKIHPMQILDFLEFVDLGNIRFLTNQDLDSKEVQLYQMIKNADALLTDYSSVFYDYLLLDRPIGFLLGDMDEYDRGFIDETPMDDMVGDKIYTFDDLIKFIKETKDGIDHYTEERKQLRDRVFTYQDGNNCKRLLEWMKNRDIIT